MNLSMKPNRGKGPCSIETLLAHIADEDPSGLHLLDVGCGSGTLTFAAAAISGHVTGLDREEAFLEEARARALREGVENVTFLLGDAEDEPYETLLQGAGVDMVLAHLCLSDAIIERASAALKPGRCLVAAYFHTDHWREAGVVSRFAYEPERLREVLEGNSLTVESLAVEQEVRHFASPEEARGWVESLGLKSKFRRSARWANLEGFFGRGGRTFTQSLCVAKARRRQGG